MTAKTLTVRLLKAMGLSAVFIAAVSVAPILHLNLPAGRRALVVVLEKALDATFHGSFDVGTIERVDVSGLVASSVVVRDLENRRVLTLTGVRAQADIPKIFYDWFFGGDSITITVDHVHVARAETRLRPDAKTGIPTIAAAFTPRPSATPRASSAPSRDVRVNVRGIELTRGFARGRVFGLPTLEADVSSVRGSVRSSPEGVDVVVSRFGTVVRGLGGTDLSGVATLRLRSPGWLATSFDGHFGDVQLGAVVRIDEGQVMASLDVPKARPSSVRALLPGYPLLEDASVELEATGKLPVLTVRGHVDAGDAHLLLQGPLRLDARAGAQLDVEGKNVDLRVVVPDAPQTRLDFLARVGVRATDPPVVQVEASTAPTRITDLALPAMDLTGAYAGGAFEGSAFLHEPGIPARVRFRLEPTGKAVLHAEANAVRLERAPRLAALLPARGVADVKLDVDIDRGKVTGRGSAQLSGVRLSGLGAERLTVTGRVDGELARPSALRVDAAVAGSGVAVGELPYDRVALKVTGPLSHPNVLATLTSPAGQRLSTEAVVRSRNGGIRVEGISLALRNEQREFVGRARSVEVLDGAVDLRDVDMSGLGGKLKGSARISKELVEIDATGRDLDLAALSELLGIPTRPRGRVHLDADVVLASDVERGNVRVQLENVTAGALDDFSGTLDARLERGELQVTGKAELLNVGTAEASVNATLAGSARSPASFRDMTGKAEVTFTRIDLALLGTALAAQGLVDRVAGKLSVRAALSREDSSALPSVTLNGFTESLEIVLPREDPKQGARAVRDLNVLFGANFDGRSGETEVSTQLVDAQGALALASLSGTVDLEAALRRPNQLPKQLANTPLLGKLLVGERSLSELPELLRPPGIRGLVRAEATLAGTLARPELSARLSVGKFGLEMGRNQRPVDLCATLAWDPHSARLTSAGEGFLSTPDGPRCAGQRVLRYGLNGGLAADGAGVARPQGTATLVLEGFPLDAVPGLGDTGVSGRSVGTISLTDTDGIPRVAASIDLRDTRVQGVPVGTGKLRVQSDERSIGANLTMLHQEGELTAMALASLDRSGSVPTLDLKQPLFVRVTAKHTDAVILTPFLRDVLSEVSGRIDADLATTLVATQAESGEDGALTGAIQGQVALEHGNIQLAGLGLRLSGVSLKAHAESAGDMTRITVDELGGRGGRSGERVSVRDGKLWLRGLQVVRAEGSVETTELPLMLEGVEQATATTRQGIAFRLEREPERMRVDLDVPYLLVALPQSTGRNVISLAENDTIEVLQPLGEPTRRSGEGLPWVFRFAFGQNVRITRSDLDLPLSGSAEVLLADEVAVTGDLELTPGGRIRVTDNTFIIESGEAHFNTGNPTNPSIRVTANWRAPDDTVVFASVIGTLEEPTLLPLTSSPGKTQEEIWALLLGVGDPDESSPGAAGALVGQQLIAPFLQNTVVRNVALRTDEAEMADRNYTTYTAAVPISEKVWFEGSYHAPSQADQSDTGGAVSGTIDWRFRPHWSLRTELGTIGTGLDLVWQYRY